MPCAAESARDRVDGGVEGGDHRAAGQQQASSDRLGVDRLVHVQHVEVAVGAASAAPGAADTGPNDSRATEPL